MRFESDSTLRGRGRPEEGDVRDIWTFRLAATKWKNHVFNNEGVGLKASGVRSKKLSLIINIFYLDLFASGIQSFALELKAES
jgi:hypothetical protein